MECKWDLVRGKRATFSTTCGKTIMASPPPEDGEECLNCGKPVKKTITRVN